MVEDISLLVCRLVLVSWVCMMMMCCGLLVLKVVRLVFVSVGMREMFILVLIWLGVLV